MPTSTGLGHHKVAPPLHIIISYDNQRVLRVELLDV